MQKFWLLVLPEKTGYPERYSPGSHVSPTMDESRRNKSTPKRK